jgi:hypothetical protein
LRNSNEDRAGAQKFSAVRELFATGREARLYNDRPREATM